MGNYISQLDLENALSAQTIAQLYADDNTGAINTAAIDAVIDRAESMVDSYLIGFYAYPLQAPFDRLVKNAALLFAEAYSFQRHPEYVRTYGENPRTAGKIREANELMRQIQSAVQKLPDQPAPETAPRNVGGIVVDTGPRLSIPSSDGTDNGYGF